MVDSIKVASSPIPLWVFLQAQAGRRGECADDVVLLGSADHDFWPHWDCLMMTVSTSESVTTVLFRKTLDCSLCVGHVLLFRCPVQELWETGV